MENRSGSSSWLKINVCLVAGLLVFAPAANAAVIPDRPTLDSILGAGQTLEDFETLAVPMEGQRSDPPPLSSTTIFDEFGPGLVEPGVTYSNVGGGDLLFWNGDGYFALITQSLGDSAAWLSRPMELTYDPPVLAFGFDRQGYSDLCQSGTIDVYDGSGALISSAAVADSPGFFGWEDVGGIGQVVLSADQGCYIMIDNHGYGVAPVVPTMSRWGLTFLTMLLLASVPVVLLRSRRSRAHW